MTQILFITSNRIGDAVLTTGLLKHLVDTIPDARLTIAAGPVSAPLFEHVPGLERLIVLTKLPYKCHWWRLWRQCITTHWDVVVDLRRSVISYCLHKRACHRLPRDTGLRRIPYLAQTLNLSPPPAPYIWIPDDIQQKAKQATHDGKPIIVLAPIANWAPKQWPTACFIDCIQQLTNNHAHFQNASLAISAASHEREAALPMLTQLREEGYLVHDWIGLPLIETAANLTCCDLFIGNDSGLMHLASAVNTPTIGLFGATSVVHYAPWGEHCLTAVSATNQMDGLTVNTVLDSIKQLILETPAP